MSYHPDHAPSGYDFSVNEHVNHEGKLHFKDCVHIWFPDPYYAWHAVNQILRQLERYNKDDPEQQDIGVSLCGRLEKTEDGNWPF